MTAEQTARAGNWIQFGLLLLAFLVIALQVEGRLSRIETKQEDETEARKLVQKQLDRIEVEIATWHSTPGQSLQQH